ncbi:MAG: protease modulator HflC [Gammaproteobacteria bacterium]|nr:protease modulator HflC [Gammaproteobacteria bacterium]
MRIAIPLLVVAILGWLSVFKVDQWEQAIVFRFREIYRSDSEPGLHFIWPFMDTVKKFELRLLNMDQEPQRYLTIEKKDVIVDYYVKWRISNVRSFYTASRGGDVEYANGLLGQRINRALRDEFGKRTVQEVVAGERGEILDIVTTTTSQLEQEMGIKVIDVRTKRIDLPEEVSSSVYDRMRAERLRVAKDFRARGEEAAERIKANADREREVILANAYRDAETIRGEGDAQATEIYAAAFGKDEEFYALYRSLNAYQNSFSDGKDVLLLEPDSEFFKYFKSPKARQ